MTEENVTPTQETGLVKYIELPEQQIKDLIEINRQLRAKVDRHEKSIASMITSAVILSKQVDFKRPWKAVAFFADLVKNPDKYRTYLKPFEELLDDNEPLRKQIEEHLEKKLAEQKIKK